MCDEKIDERVDVLEEELKKVRTFLWESVIEPNCTYRTKYQDGALGGCSAGLAPSCDMCLCPRMKPELW